MSEIDFDRDKQHIHRGELNRRTQNNAKRSFNHAIRPPRTDLVVKRSELDILGERGPMRGGPGSLSRVRRVSSIVSLGLTVTRHARHGTRHTAHGIAIYGKAVSRSRDCIKRSVSNFFLCDASL